MMAADGTSQRGCFLAVHQIMRDISGIDRQLRMAYRGRSTPHPHPVCVSVCFCVCDTSPYHFITRGKQQRFRRLDGTAWNTRRVLCTLHDSVTWSSYKDISMHLASDCTAVKKRRQSDKSEERKAVEPVKRTVECTKKLNFMADIKSETCIAEKLKVLLYCTLSHYSIVLTLSSHVYLTVKESISATLS